MRYTLLIVIVALFTQFGKCNAQDALRRYKVRSGIVKYTTSISGSVMGGSVKGEGTENLFFKNYGSVELQEELSDQTTITNMFGQKNSETEHTHTVTKIDNNKVYNVDFDQQVIYKQQNATTTAAMYSDTDADDAGREMFESLGGRKIGNETILGYNCEIWMLAGVKQWIYKGVMLKSEASVMGITTITVAQSVQFNITVADRYFELPDFPVQEQNGIYGSPISEDDMNDASAELEMMSKLSFEQWKKIVQANDEEMREKNDDELRRIYNMMQKVAKMSR